MTIAQAKSELMQIYGALSPDKQRAIDTVLHAIDVREHDKDHIWYKGGQYISLRRFLEVKAEADQEPKYCDRNICIKNEYNGIGCDECEVTKSQEPKIGHWSHDGSHWKNRFICSECGYKLFDEPTNYCPNCGCRMVEPQESEDK